MTEKRTIGKLIEKEVRKQQLSGCVFASFGSILDLGICTLKGAMRNLLKYPLDLLFVFGSSFRQKIILV